MMRFRPLTQVRLSIHRDQNTLVLFLEARADSEPEPQTFQVALTAEQATSIARELLSGVDQLR